MSPTNRKTRTAATETTGSDRHLQAVPDQSAPQNASTAEEKVRAALADNPGATAVALALAAGVGRSTAAKILARWDRDGTAVRTTSDGPRKPDTWALAPSDNTPTAPDAADAPTHAVASTDHANGAADTPPDTIETHAEPSDVPSTENGTTTPMPADAAMDGGQHVSDEKITGSDPAAPDELDADAATPPPGPAAVAPVSDTNANGSGPSSDAGPADKNRLPKGGLRAMVEEYLTEHPRESFGPAKIGKDLGRSGGAVNNALEKLVADGYAIKTCEAPKRFTINPAKTDVPAQGDNGAPALKA